MAATLSQREDRMDASGFPVLSALLAPVSVAEFLDKYWPSQPLEVHGPLERLPPMLRDPALASSAALAKRFAGRLRFTHSGSDQLVEVTNVSAAQLLDLGLSVQFIDLAACVQRARPFARQLEAELGLHEGSIGLSAFAAAHDNGLACHYDVSDLISIQLVGGKRFHYAPVREIASPCGNQYTATGAPFDELYPQATRGFPKPDGVQFTYADLRPGSVLFLPRGYWHYTTASENSLSVSVSINPPPAVRRLLDQLGCLLLQDPRWRRPLYGANREDTRSRAAEMLATLPAIASRVSADDLIDSPARPDWRLSHIEPSTRFQRTPHCGIEIDPAAASGKLPLRFVVAGHNPLLAQEVFACEVAPDNVPLLRWLETRTGGPFTVAELSAAYPQVRLAALQEVLRLCVQAQFLRLLWYPALDAVH